MSRKFLTAALAALAVASGVSASAVLPGPDSPRPTPIRVYHQQQAAPPVAPVPREVRPLGADGQASHNAFPLSVRLPDGQVRVMWRSSAGHLATNGKIFSTVGDPLTNTWAPATELVLDTSSPARDMRPAALSLIDGSVWLTYFFWEAGRPAGAYVARSVDGGVSFAPSIRVDGGRPYAAISGPVVKSPNNDLYVAWYGRNVGENVDTVFVSWTWKEDGTEGWATTRIANAIGSGKAYNEPWLVVHGSKLIALFRDGGWSGLAMRVSPDGGNAWPTAPVRILDNATGNPAAVSTSNGNIYVVYRHTVTRDAMVAVSRDTGVTWQADPTPLLRAPANLGKDSLGMVYGAPVDLGDGRVWCAVAMESSLTSARVFGVFL